MGRQITLIEMIAECEREKDEENSREGKIAEGEEDRYFE